MPVFTTRFPGWGQHIKAIYVITSVRPMYKSLRACAEAVSLQELTTPPEVRAAKVLGG